MTGPRGFSEGVGAEVLQATNTASRNRTALKARVRILVKASSAVSSASGRVCRYFSVVAMLAQAFLDDLKVGAVGEEPGGVGVAQAVHADVDVEAGGGEGGEPDLLSEPVAGDVAVGVAGVRSSGGVLAGGVAFGAVDGVGVLAVAAFGFAGGVAADGAVAVGASGGVGFGEAELVRVGGHA
ncbi:hypothetical protein GCM10023259_100780 [Thermocatellispora tengchongensis]